MKKTKDVVSEERKFLRLCGEEYKKKIKKQTSMSLKDFQKISYLINTLGFSNYYLYFCMDLFPDLLCDSSDISEVNDWNEEYDMQSSEYGILDMKVEECDMWLEEFCNQMPLERQKEKYRLLFEIEGD